MDRLSSEPMLQDRSWSKARGLVSVSPEEIPVSTAPSATPARVIRTGFTMFRPALPMKYTTAAASTAPPSANHTYPLSVETPKTPTAITMAKVAPALTPSTPGSASGLRVMAWISAPAAPRAISRQ